jgi:hypothetical protein
MQDETDRPAQQSEPLWPLLVLHGIVGFLLLFPRYIQPDSVAIYSYLRSLVIDGDLLLLNEWFGFGMVRQGITDFKEITLTGNLANHWWIGTSMVAGPYYLVAHLLSRLIDGFPDDGFFGLYGVVLAWVTLVAGALCHWTSLQLAPPEKHGLTSHVPFVAIWAGTPLLFYQFYFPLGTHLVGAAVVGFLILMLWRGEKNLPSPPFLIGLLIGLAVAVRLQHFVLIPALLYYLMGRPDRWRQLGWVAAGGAIPLAVQLLAWYTIYGSPFGPVAGGASLGGTTWMPLSRNYLGAVLFSGYHGLFTWAPVTLFAVAGWIAGLRIHRRFAFILLLMFAGQWFANGLLDRYFWGGLTFGPRRFIDLAVAFAVGLTWLLTSFRSTVLRIGVGVAVVWTLLLALAAATGTLDLRRYTTLGEMAQSVGQIGGEQLARLAASAPVAQPRLFLYSLIAMLIVGGGTIALTRISLKLWSRILLAWCVAWLAILAVVHGPTRQAAPAELERLGIDLERARAFGPLVDQRNLLSDEHDYLVRTGRLEQAAQTLREIEAVEQALIRLRQKPER